MTAHICISPWGIGSYVYTNEDGTRETGYGYFHPENPNDFDPDEEVCTSKELEAHRKACEQWNKKT